MARHVTIITPENIELVLEEAGLATRFGALLIDLMIETAVFFVLTIVEVIVSIPLEKTVAGNIFTAIFIGMFFIIFFGYFLFFETIWNGQTPGKRAFGLRVMRDGGYPLDFFSACVRNLVRIADFIPVGYLAGSVTVLVNPEYKRLGDLVAGTIVIKERMIDPRTAFRTGPIQNASGALPPATRNPYDVLTPAELALLERFVLRRWEMDPDDAERLAYRIIAPLTGRLNLNYSTTATAPRYAELASVLLASATQRLRELEASR